MYFISVNYTVIAINSKQACCLFIFQWKFCHGFQLDSLNVGGNVILSPLLSHTEEAVEALQGVLW